MIKFRGSFAIWRAISNAWYSRRNLKASNEGSHQGFQGTSGVDGHPVE